MKLIFLGDVGLNKQKTLVLFKPLDRESNQSIDYCSKYYAQFLSMSL